jgi:methylmalonyl-CoA mutase N-terminal domain/subunit
MLNNDYRSERKKFNDKTKAMKNTGMKFTTVSGEDVNVLYGPDDIENINYLSEIGFPGEYPYTRGIHANGYRGKIWTMRQFAGFGSPEDTNKRFHYLLNHGQTGLSVAFDLPTLM